MLKDIVEARAVGGHRVYLRFEDGVEGEIDVADLIEFTGVFAVLRDTEEFGKLSVNEEVGTICWPNGADLAQLRRSPVHRGLKSGGGCL